MNFSSLHYYNSLYGVLERTIGNCWVGASLCLYIRIEWREGNHYDDTSSFDIRSHVCLLSVY